ncbi:type I-E CRISPR-associated protein Cas6/Cse3/CasE [Streptomyces sp. B29(2018)]|uniref:type I-E CRISPR-associated protein Cas6/Cse3/CasE n=1 Tax=Streptomyces sp. B29(2018) TaxID=2485016 RepID=UPI000FD66D80|nr:type I-E CRISPR-associated protein Cas6/Cse3/CasE [Streptomyces sp. B29(2018)]
MPSTPRASPAGSAPHAPANPPNGCPSPDYPRAFEERGGLEKGTTRPSAAQPDRPATATGACRHVHLRTATYDGLLDVTDPDALRQPLVEGIGHGRAYGCGLLTLARCDAR